MVRENIKLFFNFLKLMVHHPDPAKRAIQQAITQVEWFPSEDASQQGTLYEHELPLLKETVKRANRFPGPFVEIGTLFGFTTQKIASWKIADKKLITVDNYCWNPWGFTPETHYAVTRNILWYLIHAGQVEQLMLDKDRFFKEYTGKSPCLVFIDADHSHEATKKDIENAKLLGTQIICGHDYNHTGVKQAVDGFGGPQALQGSFWVL